MSDQFTAFWQELVSISDSTELRQRIVAVLDDARLSQDERRRLIPAGLNRLRELWGGNSMLVLEAVEQVIIPVLRHEATDDIESRMFRYQIREMVSDLLNGLDVNDRAQARVSVLRYLEHNLLSSSTHDEQLAHRLICSIGYRDQQLFQALLEMLSDDTRAPEAFTTLVALRVPSKYREKLRPHLLEAISKCDDVPFAVQEAVNQAWLDDEIVSEICATANRSSDQHLTGSVLLSLLGRLAAQSPSNQSWQQQAWEVIRGLHRRRQADTIQIVELNSSLASSINFAGVIGDLLTWSAEQNETEKSKQISLYRRLNRLADCVRPEHLNGWTQAGQLSGEWQRLLRESATRNTEVQGRFTTIEMRVKDYAWETALCLGVSKVDTWVAEAVEFETNPYVAQSMMQQLACLDGLTFEPFLAAIVERHLDLADDEEGGEFFRQDGAITLARSCCSFKSLRALANAGLTSDKHALMSTCEALADVAVALANDDAPRVSEYLLKKAAATEPTHQRDTALFALRKLADNDLLDAGLAAPLLSFALDAQLPPNSRMTSIEALRLSPSLAKRVQIGGIVELTHDSEPEDVRYAAADFLIVSDALNELSPERLRAILKVVVVNDVWRLEETPPDRAVFSLGLLYGRNPKATKTVVVDLIERVAEWPVYSLFGNDRVSASNVVPEIIEGIVNRLLSRTSPYHVEIPLFAILANLSPTAIVNAHWENVWQSWHAEGRYGLMEAINKIPPDIIKQPERLLLLCQQLSGDGQFSVRRAAYMTLAKHFPDEFEKIAIEWPQTEDNIEIRKRSAEACEWLSGDEDLPEALAILIQDPEPEVRGIAESTRDKRLERRWAREYLASIQNGIANGEPVLSLYKFGHALERIGDDQIEDFLSRYLNEQLLRPNQSIWLRRMIDRITNRWRKVTADWPEPWVRLSGEIEEVDAEIIYAGNSHSARATLWRIPSTEPGEPYSWGGVITPSSKVSTRDQLSSIIHDDVQVRFVGRSNSEILIGGSLGKFGGMFFHGNGPYPESKLKVD